jgi:hypothetical protein
MNTRSSVEARVDVFLFSETEQSILGLKLHFPENIRCTWQVHITLLQANVNLA